MWIAVRLIKWFVGAVVTRFTFALIELFTGFNLSRWLLERFMDAPRADVVELFYYFLSALAGVGALFLIGWWQKPKSPHIVSPPPQVSSAKLEPKRDTKMEEALAYLETGEWGREFYLFMNESGKNPEKGLSTVKVRQAAIDKEIRIWGRSTQNEETYVEIPTDHWEEWQIDSMSAMRGETKTEKRHSHASGFRYYDLMVSKTEFEAKWPPLSFGASELMSVLELYQHTRTLSGWNFENEKHIYAWIRAFRAAASQNRFQVWGITKTGIFADEEIPRPIPAACWNDLEIDYTRLPFADRNSDIVTHKLRPTSCPSFRDMEVQRKPAMEWARNEAARYRDVDEEADR